MPSALIADRAEGRERVTVAKRTDWRVRTKNATIVSMNSALPATKLPAGLHLLRARTALKPFGLTTRAAEAAARDGTLPIKIFTIGLRHLKYVTADDLMTLAAHLSRPATTTTTGGTHAPNHNTR